MKSMFLVGTSRVDITPPLGFGIPTLGFHSRHLVLDQVHDSLFARTVVISQSSGSNPVALIQIDSIGFSNTILGNGENFIERLRNQIYSATGILQHQIMVAATHAHSTPETLDFRTMAHDSGMKNWLNELLEKITQSTVLAKKSMHAAELKVGSGQVIGVSTNRRGDPCLDPVLTVLQFTSTEKVSDVIIVQFACHPVIMQAQSIISADFIGSMIDEVFSSLPSVKECLFLQGACADIDPHCRSSRLFEDVHDMGIALANEVIRIHNEMRTRDYPVEPAKLRALTRVISLQSRPMPDKVERDQLKKEISLLSNPGLLNKGAHYTEQLRIKEEMYWRICKHQDEYKAEIHALVIGSIVLLGIPGEPFCAMGLAIKRSFLPYKGIPVGFANEYLGYLAPPEVWSKGGYEVQLGPWSKVGSEAYGQILNEIYCIKQEIGALNTDINHSEQNNKNMEEHS